VALEGDTLRYPSERENWLQGPEETRDKKKGRGGKSGNKEIGSVAGGRFTNWWRTFLSKQKKRMEPESQSSKKGNGNRDRRR